MTRSTTGAPTRLRLLPLVMVAGGLLVSSCTSAPTEVAPGRAPATTTGAPTSSEPTTGEPTLAEPPVSLTIPPEVQGEVSRTVLRGRGTQRSINGRPDASKAYEVRAACSASDQKYILTYNVIVKRENPSSKEPALTTGKITCDGKVVVDSATLFEDHPLQIDFVNPPAQGAQAYAVVVPRGAP